MASIGNKLLALLPGEEQALLQQSLQPIALSQGEVLHEGMQPIGYVYFLESGLSSEIALNGDERIEVGCIGREGFSGVPVVLGVDRTPHRSFMETDGSALRLPAGELQKMMDANPMLRALLLRYVQVFMIQIAATALADGRYALHRRLARWLLMAHDRLERDELSLTHEFLSLMLGVRRSGVTDAIHVLEGDGTIRATRGLITVRDRPALERVAGECYGMPEAEYRRLIGGFAT
jgi:CRP-like cAMP-binding protein